MAALLAVFALSLSYFFLGGEGKQRGRQKDSVRALAPKGM